MTICVNEFMVYFVCVDVFFLVTDLFSFSFMKMIFKYFLLYIFLCVYHKRDGGWDKAKEHMKVKGQHRVSVHDLQVYYLRTI